MNFILSLIVLSSTFVSYSQSSNWIIEFNYSGSLYEEQQSTYNTFNFSPGIECGNGFSFNLGLGYFKSNNLSNLTNYNRVINGFQTHVSVNKRFLKNKTCISPLASVTIGHSILSNRSKYFLNQTDVEFGESLLFEESTIDKFGFFSKVKFLLDFRFTNMSLRFGPTYSFHEGKVIKDPIERSEIEVLRGYGLEGTIVVSVSKIGSKKSSPN